MNGVLLDAREIVCGCAKYDRAIGAAGDWAGEVSARMGTAGLGKCTFGAHGGVRGYCVADALLGPRSQALGLLIEMMEGESHIETTVTGARS